jgi:hypothetical protein
MAYVPCVSCGVRHSHIQMRDLIYILAEYQIGNGQLVTKYGVQPICIRKILDLPITNIGDWEDESNGNILPSLLGAYAEGT